MPLTDFVDDMDLDGQQKSLLKEIIRKSMLTPISFKALSDDVLVGLGFPLPAIYELKLLVGNNEASTPNSSFSNRSEATLASALSTGNITPIRAAALTTTDTLNVEELKTLADHLNLRSKSGQNQLVRIVVAEMTKVQVSVFLNILFSLFTMQRLSSFFLTFAKRDLFSLARKWIRGGKVEAIHRNQS